MEIINKICEQYLDFEIKDENKSSFDMKSEYC